MTSRFPIVSGLKVEWDHTLPANQRVKSIRLVNPPSNDDDDDDDDENGEEEVQFVEQEDGTRIEVKQRKIELGEEVKNETGGRVYRVVSAGPKSTPLALRPRVLLVMSCWGRSCCAAMMQTGGDWRECDKESSSC